MRGMWLALVVLAGLGGCGREESVGAKSAADATGSAPATRQASDGILPSGRVGARTFNSKLPLQVWVRGAWTSKWDKHEITPAPTAVQIPECDAWAVEPLDTWDRDWAALVRVVEDEHVSGVWMPAWTGDEDLLEIKKCQRLQFLGLAKTGVTNAGTATLADIKGLQELNLSGTFVTDAGLERLTALKDLRRLDLSNCSRVTDSGLSKVKHISGLVALGLQGVGITDEGLLHLVDMRALRELDLSSTHVTDEGLTQLRDVPSLEKLDLNGCMMVTDGALPHLKELTGLKVLWLSHFLKDSTRAELQLALPKCEVR